MRFEIFKCFFNKINAFPKETNGPIAQMTQKSPNFICRMAMIHMKISLLMNSIYIGNTIANKAFIILAYLQKIIILGSYAISALKGIPALIFFKFVFIIRILPEFFKSIVLAFFASIKSAILIGIFMEFIQRLNLTTRIACFGNI